MTKISLPFQDYHINRFRGLRDVSLRDCSTVNLLVGENNSGKTSVLETMVLVSDPFNPDQWRLATQVRGSWPLSDPPVKGNSTRRLETVEWMFPNLAPNQREISIDVKGSCPLQFLRAQGERVVGQPPSKPEIKPGHIVEGFYQSGGDSIDGLLLQVAAGSRDSRGHPKLPSGNESCQLIMWERAGITGMDADPRPRVGFATPVSHRSDGHLALRAGQLLREATKGSTLSLLQQVDSRISDFWVGDPDIGSGDSLEDANPRLHVDFEDLGSVPIHSLGDGLRRVFHFAALLEEVGRGGVILIDEIEVGLHTTALKNVFQWLCEACIEREVQLFATTHSLEAVDAITAVNTGDALSLYRIRSGNKVQRYSGELLRIARFDLGQEVR